MLTDIDITFARESPEWAMGYSKHFRGSVGGQVVEQRLRFNDSYGGEETTWTNLPMNKVIGCKRTLKKSGVRVSNCDDCPYASCIAKDKEVIKRK